MTVLATMQVVLAVTALTIIGIAVVVALIRA